MTFGGQRQRDRRLPISFGRTRVERGNSAATSQVGVIRDAVGVQLITLQQW